jgi:hypothetical protein
VLFLVGFPLFVAESLADDRTQRLRENIGDLSGAKSVEVRDAAGQAVLRGQFVVGSRRDDDNERIAALRPSGTPAVGEKPASPQETNITAERNRNNGGGGRKNRNRRGENRSPRGTVEIETRKAFFGFGSPTQKLELSVRGLSADATYTLLVDEKKIATFNTTARGRAELAWEGPVPR